MKKIITLILFIAVIRSLYSYPFTIPYFDEEYFLYPYLNYDQTVEWKKAREGRLYEGGFVQTSHGSQTTWLLMSSEEAVVNQNIGDKFIFRFRYRDLTSRHLSYSEKESSIGIGFRGNEILTLLSEVELTDKKEEIDAGLGILFSFQSIYAYFGTKFDDLLFDLKNLGDGTSNKLPLTLNSNIRFSFNRLYFFFSTRYGTGIDREWSTGPYTEILMHKNYIRKLYTRIEYDITDYIKIYQENHLDYFYDSKLYKDSTLDISEYKFTAETMVSRIGGIWRFSEMNTFEAGITYAATDHKFELLDGQALTNGHARSYKIDYPAFLPYLIYKYRIHSKFTTEAAYMASYTAKDYDDNYYFEKSSENYWDKELIKAGLEYRFSPNCSLYVSAGQLINTGVFGGGNARLNIFF